MKCLLCMKHDLILNPLINVEPMKRLENWRHVAKFRSFDDSTSSSIENQLKSICLIEHDRPKTVFRVNSKGGTHSDTIT